jgi:hypothetical protein
MKVEKAGGPEHHGSLVIRHDEREGLDGWFEKAFAVKEGEFYRFAAVRKLTGVAVPRRSALVRILWQDDAGRMPDYDLPASDSEDRPAGQGGQTPFAASQGGQSPGMCRRPSRSIPSMGRLMPTGGRP